MNSFSLKTIRTNWHYLFGWCLLFVLLILFARTPLGESFSRKAFDSIRFSDAATKTVIVGVDDASLKSLGAWPWDRSIFAKLNDALFDYGVRGVAYDVLFLEKRTGDDVFAKSIGAHKGVVLGSKLESGKELTPIYNSPSTLIGVANIIPDLDGKVRALPLFVDGIDSMCKATLSSSMLFIALPNIAYCDYKGIDTFRYNTTISTLSLIDVINHNVATSSLIGRFVFIGSTSLDLEDHFIGMQGEKIPGVFVHASIFASLVNNDIDIPVGFLTALLLIAAVGVLISMSVYTARLLLMQLFLFIMIEVGVVIVSVVLFERHTVLPLSFMLLSGVVFGGYTILYRFVRAKKQNEKIEMLFSKYVHKDVLRELMASGRDIKLGGEMKNLSILFSDLRGFTTLSETMSPEELTSILNAYLSAMSPHILEERGTIDKFIGDAIMAFWNAPLPVEDHALRAVRSAMRMHKALALFNQKNNTTLAIGIGIHKGNAIVGNVGSTERVNYTILGDTVNTASRLESLTKKYGVVTLVSEDVRNAITDEEYEWRKLETITVKGKHEPTVIYEVRERGEYGDRVVAEYEEALVYYEKGEFEKASLLFTSLAHQGDLPSEKILEKINHIDRTTWDGVYRWDEK